MSLTTAWTVTWKKTEISRRSTWEAEDGATLQLHVCRAARARLQIRKCASDAGSEAGDCVAIYMPMIPELPIAMLACARIGAVHSVVFGGFSAPALADRIKDCRIETADHRRWRISSRTSDPAERKQPTSRLEKLPDH